MLWIIMRSIGEYSDRDVAPIRFARSEEEAMRLIDLADREGRERADEMPEYPKLPSTHHHQLADGSFWEGYVLDQPKGSQWVKKPDGDQIRVANEAADAKWRRDVKAMGCVDPDGPNPNATYYAEAVEDFDGAERVHAQTDRSSGSEPKTAGKG